MDDDGGCCAFSGTVLLAPGEELADGPDGVEQAGLELGLADQKAHVDLFEVATH